jgi:hypothetical protein
VNPTRFLGLAAELAARDKELPAQLALASEAGERLRAVARSAVDAFRAEARRLGAEHLAHVEVGPLEPDEKHVDCLQLRIERGRWRALCVVKAAGTVTLVGPFKRGGPEKPCSAQPLVGEQVERAVEDLVESLIRAAAER